MLKGFEDAFVDAQANVISLCLEFIRINNGQFPKVTLFR